MTLMLFSGATKIRWNGIKPADFRWLPIFDVNLGDTPCVFSTLNFIGQQAKKLCIETACVTFDQPLWLKAVEITKAEKMTNIVCKLGGFHMLMSYLGSVGSVMAGSGLAEVLECCYGPNTVQHMLTGKAVSRAILNSWSLLTRICIKYFIDPLGHALC